jgi:hypothetical protein
MTRVLKGKKPRAHVKIESVTFVNKALIKAKVWAVSVVFHSDADLARTLGVHRSNVVRWKRGERPERENWERLVGIETVVSLLTGFLDDRSIPKWLHGFNAHLGDRRPVDVIREGRLSEVIAAIEAEKAGSFA